MIKLVIIAIFFLPGKSSIDKNYSKIILIKFVYIIMIVYYINIRLTTEELNI